MMRITWLFMLLLTATSCIGQTPADSTRIAELLSILRERHFAPRTIDDRFSADVHDAYLRALDPDTLLLSLAERTVLAGHRFRIDDQLAQGVPAFAQQCDSLMHAGLLRAMALVERPDDAGHHDISARWDRMITVRSTALRSAMHGTEDEATALVRTRMRTDLRDRIARGRTAHMDLFLATLANVHDAQSTYLSPMARTEFESAMTQAFVGVGVALSDAAGHIRIDGLEPGGPAARSGALAVGDELMTIREASSSTVPVPGLSIAAVVEQLRGPAGSTVELRVRKADGSLGSVSLQRALIQPEAGRAQAKVLRSEGALIGLITLPRFYTDLSGGDGPRCSKDVSDLLDSLLVTGIDGLVVDLRDDQGGSMSETINILGLFLDPAPVAQRLARDGTLRVLSTTEAHARYRGPLVVLVNARSASASEFFAAALQDNERAVIVGSSRTYGKGSIQSMVDLSPIAGGDGDLTSAGAAKITVGLFFRPSGGSVQWEGVTPDVVLPIAPELSEPFGERALPFALRHDGIAACTITPWSADGPTRADLLARVLNHGETRSLAATASPVRASWSTQGPEPVAPLNADDAELAQAVLLLHDAAGGAALKPR